MDAKKRASALVKLLNKKYPQVKIALKYESPMQLLAAVILSAQCTDVRVNLVTRELFRKYRTVNDFASADLRTFQNEIRSTGFYRNKAKNIIGSAKMIKSDFKGKIPDQMESLLKLPGVARKTANVVLSTLYDKNEGICIDTHCIRLTQRWGLTKSKNPVSIERELMPLVPRKDWENFSLMTIKHGRELCYARKPQCKKCFLNKICPSAFNA